MISERYIKIYCCEDISKIENYETAVNSSEKWVCHHRLETHNSDGERRLVDITKKELIALGMYYHRPAEELIFMTTLEHERLHKKERNAVLFLRRQRERYQKHVKNGLLGIKESIFLMKQSERYLKLRKVRNSQKKLNER